MGYLTSSHSRSLRFSSEVVLHNSCYETSVYGHTPHPNWIATSTATRHGGTHRGNRLLRAATAHTHSPHSAAQASRVHCVHFSVGRRTESPSRIDPCIGRGPSRSRSPHPSQHGDEPGTGPQPPSRRCFRPPTDRSRSVLAVSLRSDSDPSRIEFGRTGSVES